MAEGEVGQPVGFQIAGHWNQQLRAPRRALFARAGASGTRLAGLEVVPLDSIHVIARTTWDVVFDGPHAPVVLRSSFLLRRTEDGWRIAVYLNHESLLGCRESAVRPEAGPDAACCRA